MRLAALSIGLAAAVAAGENMKTETVRVLKTGEEVYIRSRFAAERDLVVRVGRGTNRQINFRDARLIDPASPMTPAAMASGTLPHSSGDDSTPWNINGTYIGGNHGCSDGIEITCTNHARTVADLGSEWQDAAGHAFYLIKIVDADKLWILGRNRGKADLWSFERAMEGNTLTNRAGVALTRTDQRGVQICPACRIRNQEYLLNGTTHLADGVEASGTWLDIVEEYDIINPASLLADIVSHPGQERDFTAAHLDGVIRNHIVYRFHPNGANVIYYRARALQEFNLGYMGFIQTARLHAEKDETVEYYIPKTVPFAKDGIRYDFRGIQDYSAKPSSPLSFLSKEDGIENPANLPDRFIQFLSRRENGATVREFGYALGYSLVHGITVPETRARNASSPAMLYTSSKSYPVAVDSKMACLIPANTEFYCVAYRHYFDPRAGGKATCVYWQQQEDDVVIYADYHQAVARDLLRLPAHLTGKQFTVVEKTPSLTLRTEGAVPAEGVAVTVAGGYGYIVLRIPCPASVRP